MSFPRQKSKKILIDSLDLIEQKELVLALRDYKLKVAPFLVPGLGQDFDKKIEGAFQQADKKGVIKTGVKEVVNMLFDLSGDSEQEAALTFFEQKLRPQTYHRLKCALTS